MYCLDCRYALSRLTCHRCPECGRPFDPRNRFSYRVTPTGLAPITRRNLKYNAILAFWCALFLLVVMPHLFIYFIYARVLLGLLVG